MNNWHKIVGIFIGLWLLAAPATFGYPSTAMMWSDIVAGLVLIVLGPLFPLVTYGAVGLWLSISPLLFWAPDAAAYLNNTLLAAILFAFYISTSGAIRSVSTERAIPPGMSYNPSTWPQRLPVAFLAFVCWMISRYLTAYQLGLIDTVWDPFFGNGTMHVLTSNVSRAFPVPDAGLGAFAYTLEMLSAFLGDERRWRTMPWMVLIFGVLTVPVSLVSVILVILQPLAVGAWCTLCLVTAFFMLIGIPLAITEVMATLRYLRGNRKALFHGGDCPTARTDTEHVSVHGPLWPLIRAMKRGVTAPWNLVLTSLVGAFLMAMPGLFGFEGVMAEVDRIVGPLIIVCSVVAFADMARKVRLMNWVLVIPLVVVPFFAPALPMLHWIAAVVVAGLSIYQTTPSR
jgi:hypothetical protein